MKIFAISDLHLSFGENIDKPMDKFGEGWEHHAERLKAAAPRVLIVIFFMLPPLLFRNSISL